MLNRRARVTSGFRPPGSQPNTLAIARKRIRKLNGRRCPSSSVAQWRTNYVEPKSAELPGQDRSGGCDRCLNVRVFQRAPVRFRRLPYLHDEDGVGRVDGDADLVEVAAKFA